MWWINHLPCKSEIAGSIPGFTSLSDETLSCGPRLYMTFTVGGILNTNKHILIFFYFS